jgi:antitoxin ParD1/3/4
LISIGSGVSHRSAKTAPVWTFSVAPFSGPFACVRQSRWDLDGQRWSGQARRAGYTVIILKYNDCARGRTWTMPGGDRFTELGDPVNDRTLDDEASPTIPIFGIRGISKNTPFSIGEHFSDFIEAQVSEGRYGSAGDAVRAGLRLLEQVAKLVALRAALIEG